MTNGISFFPFFEIKNENLLGFWRGGNISRRSFRREVFAENVFAKKNPGTWLFIYISKPTYSVVLSQEYLSNQAGRTFVSRRHLVFLFSFYEAERSFTHRLILQVRRTPVARKHLRPSTFFRIIIIVFGQNDAFIDWLICLGLEEKRYENELKWVETWRRNWK